MKIFVALLSVLLFSLAGPASATVAQYQVRGVKTGDHLNLRAAPSHKARIVGRIPAHGREIEIIARGRGPWVKISYGRAQGFVNRRFLVLSKPRAARAVPPVSVGTARSEPPATPAAVKADPAALDSPAAMTPAVPSKPAAPATPETALPGQGPEDRTATPDLMKPPADLMPESVPTPSQ